MQSPLLIVGHSSLRIRSGGRGEKSSELLFIMTTVVKISCPYGSVPMSCPNGNNGDMKYPLLGVCKLAFAVLCKL